MLFISRHPQNMASGDRLLLVVRRRQAPAADIDPVYIWAAGVATVHVTAHHKVDVAVSHCQLTELADDNHYVKVSPHFL